MSGIIGFLEYRAASSDHDKAATTHDLQMFSDLLDSADSKRTTSIVLGIAGAALVGGGVIRFLLHDRGTEHPVQIVPMSGGGAITWGGRF